MGGAFSGQRWHKKRTVEDCHALDTADLKRLGLLAPGERVGVLRWTRGGNEVSAVGYTTRVGESAGTLRLSYRPRSAEADVAYPVELVPTGCHLGGKRWWFVCPLARGHVVCGRRVRKLYLVGRYFGCRHCHALTYTSTQTSDPRVYSALRGGIDFTRFDDMEGMSVAQLGLSLRVLTLQQKRLDRLGKRLDGRSKRNRTVGP
jgi:hypothetical protein